MPIHNEAKKEEIAKIVLMPGDPLRAKYIAENFLEDYKLVNQVRNMFAYTGKYKNKEITVMASGMGIPSMGIYSYELYNFYDVDTIIRIGSCGAYDRNIKLFDTLLVEQSYTLSRFSEHLTGEKCDTAYASEEINQIIEKTAKEQEIPYTKTNVFCSELMDDYIPDLENFKKKLPKDKNITSSEMESFALFCMAKYCKKKAACLLTVVDAIGDNKKLSSEDREKSLNNMIKLALESAVKQI